MDAVRYLEETRRMCRFFSHVACLGWPALINRQNCMFADVIVNYGTKTTDAVAIVEEWSAAHPRKTRQSVFLEQWPNAKVFVDGVLDFCPQELDSRYPCQSTDVEMRCQSCRREFWMQEVEK